MMGNLLNLANCLAKVVQIHTEQAVFTIIYLMIDRLIV
jgi:hypothetical protein